MTDSVGGLVIPQEILVRSETYVFWFETLVQKDYKKICLHFLTVLLP